MRSVTSSRPLLLMFMVFPLPKSSRTQPEIRYCRSHDIGYRRATIWTLFGAVLRGFGGNVARS